MDIHDKTKVIIEALPYLEKYHDKIVVIKLGGKILTDMKHVVNDISLLKHIGMKPIVIHGGGPVIDKELIKQNIKPKFINGLRYTDKDTMKVVKNVFEKINENLVSGIKKHKAIASNVKKCIKVKQKNKKLGFVGEVVGIDKDKILSLLELDHIPIISPLGFDEKGDFFNINADTVAAHVAIELKAEKLTILTNVKGIQINNKLQSHVDFKTAEKEIESGIINKGMIPKVAACIYAVKNKCPKAHLINGLVPHSLLLEIFTDKGIGTEIVYENGHKTDN